MGVVHHFCDGVYAKEQALPSGFCAVTHKHAYDHISILAKGRCVVVADGVRADYVAPACVVIAKGVVHTIEAVEDSVWYCIHATDETDPDKVDEVLIEKGVSHAVG